jgi:hypothetical protein
MYKKGSFISCVNNILTEFAFVHPSVKSKLLQIYGTSFYGSQLWNLYGNSIKRLFTTWNIALRRLFHLPYRTHTRFLDSIVKIKHIRFTLKSKFLSFFQALWKTKNTLVYNLSHHYVLNNISPTGRTLSRILNEYELCDLSLVPYVIDNLSHELKMNYDVIHGLSEVDKSYCNVIDELIECVYGSHSIGIERQDCLDMINYLCTL